MDPARCGLTLARRQLSDNSFSANPFSSESFITLAAPIMAIALTQVSAVISAVVVIKALYDFFSFIALYLKPPTYRRYLRSSSSYALVTGATEGIGKAVAKELYTKGFNLIIHCYDEEKLRRVQHEFMKGGSRDVKVWLADARAQDIDFEAAVAQWKDLEITLVINNVGGTALRPTT